MKFWLLLIGMLFLGLIGFELHAEGEPEAAHTFLYNQKPGSGDQPNLPRFVLGNRYSLELRPVIEDGRVTNREIEMLLPLETPGKLKATFFKGDRNVVTKQAFFTGDGKNLKLLEGTPKNTDENVLLTVPAMYIHLIKQRTRVIENRDIRWQNRHGLRLLLNETRLSHELESALGLTGNWQDRMKNVHFKWSYKWLTPQKYETHVEFTFKVDEQSFKITFDSKFFEKDAKEKRD